MGLQGYHHALLQDPLAGRDLVGFLLVLPLPIVAPPFLQLGTQYAGGQATKSSGFGKSVAAGSKTAIHKDTIIAIASPRLD